MHILFTAYEFVTEKRPCGGCGHYIANIASLLASKGNQVTVLVLSNHNSSFQWKENIEVITFQYQYEPSIRSIFTDFIEKLCHVYISENINKSFAYKKQIIAINKKKKIDIIQHNGDHLEGWCRNRKIPTVIRLSSFYPWLNQANNKNSDMEDMSWLNSYESKFFMYPFTKADGVFAPSKRVAGFVNSCLPKRVSVIESPFMLDNRLCISHNIDILKNQKYLLFFGRICILKGIYTIIDALYQVLEENPELYFCFVGHIEQKGLYDRILNAAGEYRNRVVVLGEVKDRQELQGIIANAEACVLPSRADNLPNTCIEAMGMGKIVIGTYGASYEQLIKHKKSGILIKIDSKNALLKAIRYVMNMSTKEKERMSGLAKQRIEKMHPDIVYQQIIDFYNKTIHHKSRLKKKIVYFMKWVQIFLKDKE